MTCVTTTAPTAVRNNSTAHKTMKTKEMHKKASATPSSDHKAAFARLFQENCNAGMSPNEAAAKALLALKALKFSPK